MVSSSSPRKDLNNAPRVVEPAGEGLTHSSSSSENLRNLLLYSGIIADCSDLAPVTDGTWRLFFFQIHIEVSGAEGVAVGA